MIRKRICQIVCMLVAFLGLTGCYKDTKNNELSGALGPITPGMNMYNAAAIQNRSALQLADVAFRVAILYSEAFSQEKLDSLDHVMVGQKNLKTLLFGEQTQVFIKDQDFHVVYASDGGVWGGDILHRTGAVKVSTDGRKLEDTGEESGVWSVCIDDEPLHLIEDKIVVNRSDPKFNIMRECENGYRIIFDAFSASTMGSVSSSWNGNFLLTTDKAADLGYWNIRKASFLLNGTAYGRSFYAFNDSSMLEMSYGVRDGLYDLTKSDIVRMIGGTEGVHLSNPANYDAEEYLSPDVALTWMYDDGGLSYLLSYNGTEVHLLY